MRCLFTGMQKQYIILKSSLLFKKNANFTGECWRILKIKDAKFFNFVYMNSNIKNFQFYISVPLSE